MIVKSECYIIQTRRKPTRYSADDRLEFYDSGELTEVIEDAYKWVDGDDAEDYRKKMMPFEDCEVKKVNITYEVN